MPILRLLHEVGEKLTVLHGDEPVLVYQFAFGLPKPFCHPICAPGGHCITLNSPHDHIHHRGLFLAWSKVNGVNFWEEKAELLGRIEHRRVDLTLRTNESVRFVCDNAWHNISPGANLLLERRTITVHHPSHEEGWWCFDWESVLTPVGGEVRFDSPPNYNGLGCRFARSMDGGITINSEGQNGVEQTNGQRARWCDYSGRLDESHEWVGLAMFDHPQNPRHPTPWFCMNEPFGFLTAALTFHEPYIIPTGRSLRLRYRIVVHSGQGEREMLERLYQEWVKGEASR